MLTDEQKRHIAAQVELSKSLSLGIALSLIPIASIATLIIGLRAAKKIKTSPVELTGTGSAKWCICMGYAGLGIVLIVIPALLLDATQY